MFVKLSASLLATEKALGLPAGVRKEMPAPPMSGNEITRWLMDNNG
jgi:hypothetical protein